MYYVFQVALYLGIKSFKRKYPDLNRRNLEPEEKAFLKDRGLVSEAMCDLGILYYVNIYVYFF